MTNTSVVVYTAGNSAPSSQGKVAVDTPVATEILTKAGSVRLSKATSQGHFIRSFAKYIFLGSGYKLLWTIKDDLRLLTHIIKLLQGTVILSISSTKLALIVHRCVTNAGKTQKPWLTI